MQAAPNILHIVVIMCVVCAVVGRGVRKRKEERGDASSPTNKNWNMTHADTTRIFSRAGEDACSALLSHERIQSSHPRAAALPLV